MKLTTVANSISIEERRQREEAVNFARANIQLSGFVIGDALEAHARRFVNGEISLDEFVKHAGEMGKNKF